jgi:hypothetical protein
MRIEPTVLEYSHTWRPIAQLNPVMKVIHVRLWDQIPTILYMQRLAAEVWMKCEYVHAYWGSYERRHESAYWNEIRGVISI